MPGEVRGEVANGGAFAEPLQIRAATSATDELVPESQGQQQIHPFPSGIASTADHA